MYSLDFLHSFPWQIVGAFFAAMIAGAINSVAGGGGIISLPILISLGVPPLSAIATNNFGLWAASLGSVAGMRQAVVRLPRRVFWLLLPIILGAFLGARLLSVTPHHALQPLVPLLLLLAICLFAWQKTLQQHLSNVFRLRGPLKFSWALVAQFFAGIYGGFFGPGVRIIILAVLGLLPMGGLLATTALANILGFAVNFTSSLVYWKTGLIIDWPLVAAMLAGGAIGGYITARWLQQGGNIRNFRQIFIFLALMVAMLLAFQMWL